MEREGSSEPDLWSPWDRYGACANHYQVYNGTDPEAVQFVIVFIDDASGEVFQRIDNLATMLGP